MLSIHPTATISAKAQIADNAVIGQGCSIDDDVIIESDCILENNVILKGNTHLNQGVKIGSNSIVGDSYHLIDIKTLKPATIKSNVVIGPGNVIENNVTIKGNTNIGQNNIIGAYCTIGFPAQGEKDIEKPTYLKIGDSNHLREYVSIQMGSSGGSGVTQLGSKNILLIYCHMGHDTKVGDHCALSNSTHLAGHVQMGSYVVTGGFSAFHQYTRVGDYVMVGGMSGVYQDVAPYVLVTGHRAKVYGINTVGLKRNGFVASDIQQVQALFNCFFEQSLPPVQAKKLALETVPKGPIRNRFIEFIEGSKRGLVSKDVI